METLSELLQRLLREHYAGKKSAMAKAIRITPSPLGKVIEGTVRYLGVERCLRLAADTGESPSYVLRVAKKQDIADLIESLYGKTEVHMSVVDHRLLALPLEAKKQLLTFVDSVKTTEAPEPANPFRKRTNRRGGDFAR